MSNPPIQMRPTSTLLDTAIGGLGQGQLHIILGPDTQWTSTLAIAFVHASHAAWGRVMWAGLHLPQVLVDLPNVEPLLDHESNVNVLAARLTSSNLGGEDLVVIDNMSLFAPNTSWTSAALGWNILTDRAHAAGTTLLLAGDKVPGKALDFQAHLKLTVEEIAAVKDSEQSIVKVSVLKHRTRPKNTQFVCMTPNAATLLEA